MATGWEAHRTSRWAVGLLIVLGLVPAFFTPTFTQAQGMPPPGWTAPINLSDTLTQSEAPAIVADSTGMVHVFWGENVEESTNYSNAIFYASWDGQAWSTPRDVILSPEGLSARAAAPAVVAGRDGRLHLLFTGGWNSRLYYTSARADEAFGAGGWSQPVSLSPEGVSTAGQALIADPQGRLHAIYVVYQGVDQGVYYLRSEDEGRTWSAAVRIPGSRLGADTMLGDPTLAVSDDGALHAMWFWAALPESFPPKGLIYARSIDGGGAWSPAEHFADGPFRNPVLATRAGEEVHAVWSGTMDQRHKFYRWSLDGGIHWSSPAQIPDLGGLQGFAGLAADSAGVLHLALVGSHPRYGDSLYHYRWDGSVWIGPNVLMEDPRVGDNMANAAIAASEGNLLHVVVASPVRVGDGFNNDIFFVRGTVAAPHLKPMPLPTVTQAPLPTSSGLPVLNPAEQPAAAAPSETSTASKHFPTEQTVDPAGGGIEPLTAGVAAIIVMLGLVIVAQVRGRRR